MLDYKPNDIKLKNLLYVKGGTSMLKYNFDLEEQQMVVPVQTYEFAHFYSPAERLVEMAFKIDPGAASAMDLIDSIYSEAKPIVKMIEKMEMAQKKPHKDAIQKITQAASKATDRLEMAIEIAKEKASLYSKWMEEQRQMAIEECGKSGEIMTLEAAQMSGEGSSIVTKTKRNFKIIDINKIPINYLEPNEKLIKYTINNSENKIPGIEIYEETTTSLRLKASK